MRINLLALHHFSSGKLLENQLWLVSNTFIKERDEGDVKHSLWNK